MKLTNNLSREDKKMINSICWRSECTLFKGRRAGQTDGNRIFVADYAGTEPLL